MGAAPAAQCCYLGCALGVSRARWLGGAPHCCLVRCLNCHPAALVLLLCAAGPAAAAVGAQPPRPPVAGGRRRQLPPPSGADSRCGARAQAVAVPAPGGQGWWPVSPSLQPVRPMGRWHVLVRVHREPRPDDRAMFRSLPSGLPRASAPATLPCSALLSCGCKGERPLPWPQLSGMRPAAQRPTPLCKPSAARSWKRTVQHQPLASQLARACLSGWTQPAEKCSQRHRRSCAACGAGCLRMNRAWARRSQL